MKDIQKPFVVYEDKGTINYQEAFEYQKKLQTNIIQEKRLGAKPRSVLLFCEHDHVYTIGKSGDVQNLVYSEDELKKKGIEYYKTNRGGDITYHGPGQITGYPIFDLDQFYNDVHRYVRELEEVIIRTLSELDIRSHRIQGYTGVWLPPNKKNNSERKICAIGVHMSRWVSMHGFALNVNTDLQLFDGIVPCGILESDKTVTSIQNEIQNPEIDLSRVKLLLKKHFKEVFDFEWL